MYGANLIYGVRLRVNVGERQAKKILKCIATLFWKKKKKQKKTKKKKKKTLRKRVSCRMNSLEKVISMLISFSVSIVKLWWHIFLPKQVQTWWYNQTSE